MAQIFKKKILIDLDGVLNEYKGQYYADTNPEIKAGVVNFLENLSNIGDLYLFTTRNLKLSAKWLYDNNIDKYFKDITNVKIPAFVYIDDRAICFENSFEETLDKIKNFKPYWK